MRKRKYSALKHARRSVVGLICYLSDKTPLEPSTDIYDHVNDFCMEQIKDAMRHGDISSYHHTEFWCECVGL